MNAKQAALGVALALVAAGSTVAGDKGADRATLSISSTW